MASEHLSKRAKQPGHDRTFEVSEKHFILVARDVLDMKKYEVVDKPKDLRNLFAKERDGDRDLGVEFEAAIVHRESGRRFYVEVKKQGAAGNAEERAAKHHTVQFYKTMHDRFGYSFHPVVTVFCENLAVDSRYTRKFKYLYEPAQYFLWANYERSLLSKYLNERCSDWLEFGD